MTPVQTYARIAGILFLISFLGGGFGEFYVPSTLIVANDPNATFNNIVSHETLFRLGFAGYLLEGLCDAALALVLYVLLKPVHRNLALLAAFFGLIATAHFAICEMFFFAGPMLLKAPVYLQTFSKDQLSTLSYIFIRIYTYGSGLFMVFYGCASLIRGYLIYRSGYLPRALGVLLALLGVGFILKNFTLVLAPRYSSDFLLLPAPITVLALTLWLLIKGVDVASWEARVAETRNSVLA
ncbi:MAG TPA: DUF4386 domain-containing protein [Gemmatimonadaceae bacterium]|jgi:hypothetical protein